MYEIMTDKVMTACVTMIWIYLVNVTANNQKKCDIYICEPARDTLKV